MGNTLNASSKSDSVNDNQNGKQIQPEKRIFPSHMYTGPLKLGDPNYRGLSNREKDPLLAQRMRDIARIDLCTEAVAKFNDCGVAAGFTIIFKCRKEKDEMYGCIENWVTNEDFQQAVKEEYLNERSHYRQSGIHTMRYEKHSFIPRDVSVHGPAVDENGKYVPRLPKDWNETYKGSLPHWAQAKSE